MAGALARWAEPARIIFDRAERLPGGAQIRRAVIRG